MSCRRSATIFHCLDSQKVYRNPLVEKLPLTWLAQWCYTERKEGERENQNEEERAEEGEGGWLVHRFIEHSKEKVMKRVSIEIIFTNGGLERSPFGAILIKTHHTLETEDPLWNTKYWDNIVQRKNTKHSKRKHGPDETMISETHQSSHSKTYTTLRFEP